MAFEELVADLRVKVTELRRRAEEARSVLEERERELLRGEQGLAALTGERLPGVKVGRGTRASGRGVTVVDVVRELHAVLRVGPLPVHTAKSSVEERLRNLGRPLQGFGLRWKQASGKSDFELRGDTIQLTLSGNDRPVQ